MAGKDTDTSSPKKPTHRNFTRSELRSMSTLNLSKDERERLVKPLLPPPRVRRNNSGSGGGSGNVGNSKSKPRPTSTRKSSRRSSKSKPIRSFVRAKVHFLAYFLIHIFLGIYVRIRQGYHAVVDRVLAILYYHHRTPELIRKDVRGLSRLPEHLSAVLTLKKEEDALEVLMDEVAELAAWSSCAGIPALSVYERTGVLKSYIPALHNIITSKLSTYYGHPSHHPTLNLFAPHHPLYTPASSSTATPHKEKENTTSLTLLLLSATDGRDTLVDLTKTLADMAQHGKLSPQDISPKLIDAEISETMSTPNPKSAHTNTNIDTYDENGNESEEGSKTPLINPEPDLLLVFGPIVKLDGYPPWQMRLTEIFCTGDKSSSITGDGETVEYQRFLKGLWRFAGAEMRFGR